MAAGAARGEPVEKAAAVAKFWEMLSTSAKMKKEEAKKTGAVGEAMAAVGEAGGGGGGGGGRAAAAAA